MTKKILILSIVFILIANMPLANAASTSMYCYVDSNTLRIGNDKIELQFNINNTFYLSALIDKSNGKNYIAGNNDSYLYFNDGILNNASNINYIGYTEVTNTSSDLIVDVKYENTSRNLILHRKIHLKPNEYFVEEEIGFENNGSGNILFEQNTGHPSEYFLLSLLPSASVEYMSVHWGNNDPHSYVFDSPATGTTDGIINDPVMVAIGYNSMNDGVVIFVPFFAEINDCPHKPFECRLEDDNGYQSISISNYIDVVHEDETLWMSPIHFGIFHIDWTDSVYSFLKGRETVRPPIRYNNYGAYVLKNRARTDEAIREDANYLINTGVEMYHAGHGIWQADGTYKNATDFNLNYTKSYLASKGISSLGSYVWEWKLSSTSVDNYDASLTMSGTTYMNLGEPAYLETMWNDYSRILGTYGLKLIQFDMWRYSNTGRDTSPSGYSWSYATAWRWHHSIWQLVDRMSVYYPDAWFELDCSEVNQCIIDLNWLAKYPRFIYFMTNEYAIYADGGMNRNPEAALKALQNAFGIIPASRFSYPFFFSNVSEPCDSYGPINNISLDLAASIIFEPRMWGDLPNMTPGEKDKFRQISDMYKNLSPHYEVVNTISGDHFNVSAVNIDEPTKYAISDMTTHPKSGIIYDLTFNPGITENTENFGISLPIDYTATPTPPHHDSDMEYFGISIPISYSADDNSSGFVIQDSNIPYLAIAGLAVFFPILGLLIYKEKRR